MNEKIESMELFAWVGLDEFGSEKLGIKQAKVPAGIIPIVSTSLNKINQQYIIDAMNSQGIKYSKKISLCKFTFKKTILEVGNINNTHTDKNKKIDN